MKYSSELECLPEQPRFAYKVALDPVLFDILHIDYDVNKVRQNLSPQKPSNSINLYILSGFISALGATAVILAFTILNAATLGTLGVCVAIGGLATTLAGIGLFKFNYDRNNTVAPATTNVPAI